MADLQPFFDRGIQCWGHSMVEASAGSTQLSDRWPAVLSRNLGRLCTNFGVGGETSTQAAARFTGYNAKVVCPQVWWLFRNDNSNSVTNATSLANLASMVALMQDDRFIILSDLWYTDGTEPAGSAARTVITTINAAVQAAYPNNYLDITAALDDNSLRVDGLHPNAAGYKIVEAAVRAEVLRRRW